MLAVAGSTPAVSAAGERRARSSPELDANLRTARAQMADWVTCPSAKTPEGKAKIEQISGKLDAIKLQIEKSDTAPPSAQRPEPAATRAAAASADDTVDYRSAPGRVGRNIDTWA